MIAVEQISTNKKFNRFVLYFSIGLFVLSLVLPCFRTENDGNDASEGFLALLIGFFGPFSCPAWFSWTANPILLISWTSFNKRPRKSLILSFFASIVCLSFLAFDSIKMGDTDRYSRIISHEYGYWVWTASAFVLFIGNLIRYIDAKCANT